MLIQFEIDPDEVIKQLQRRGVETPQLGPSAAPTPLGPFGPWVYFPLEKWSAVTQELTKAYPPGTGHWGTNRSKWKQGHWYVNGEDHIPMEEIVRRVVKDKKSVEVLTFEEGLALEHATAPRRYRTRPPSEPTG